MPVCPGLCRTACTCGLERPSPGCSLQLPWREAPWQGLQPATELSSLQVDSKATLGLGGVAVVLGAVMASMGFFAYLGIPSSLVILQVVPFLVLAVGADNIFIFVLEYQVRGVSAALTARHLTRSRIRAWVLASVRRHHPCGRQSTHKLLPLS